MNLLNRMCLQNSPGLISVKISIDIYKDLELSKERSSIISPRIQVKTSNASRGRESSERHELEGVGRWEGMENEAHGEVEVPCAVQRAQWPLSSSRLLSFGNLY